jgi:ATP-dependent DNA helicase RecG
MSEVLSKKDYDKVLPIIEYLEENDRIKPKEAERVTGRSAATIRRYLGILVDAGAIQPEGSTNNSIYVKK